MNSKIFFLSCIILMFISGCTGSSNPSYIDVRQLRQGTTGLTLSFVPSDAITVMEDQQFNVNVMVKNDGAYNVDHLYMLYGVESDYVQMDKTYFNGQEAVYGQLAEYLPNKLLKGRDFDNPYGESAELEAELTAKKITLSKLQETMVSAVLCYGYRTIAEDEVCIQPSVSMIGLEPACVPKDLSFTGQGAPLVVTKVEVKSSLITNNQVRTVFRIYIENKGTGKVLYWDAGKEVCSPKPLSTPKTWNYFLLSASVGTSKITCNAPLSATPTYYELRLKNKKAEVVCEMTSPRGVAYETPMNIDLSYDYTQTAVKKLNIERIY